VFRDAYHRTPGRFCHPQNTDVEGERDENDLRGYGPCFRVHDRHGRDHDHCADRVMRDLLTFLGHGFALFDGGGPAVIYQYPALSRSVVIVQARRRGGGSSE
jgi:hypothetical protein